MNTFHNGTCFIRDQTNHVSAQYEHSLSESSDVWKAIPNAYFSKYGGLPFLLKCNYNTKELDNNIPLFYLELLDYFSELRDQYKDDCFKGDFIIWNNKHITIEGESLYWKTWRERGVYIVQDLFKHTGKYLSYEEFKTLSHTGQNY